MLSIASLIGFGIAVTPLVVTPGASFTLVSSRGLVGDRRGAWAVIVGTALGIITHGLLAGLGLAAVVMRSAEVYQVLRFVGAIYLVGLGVFLIWRGRRMSVSSSLEYAHSPSKPVVHEVGQAYLANVLNVKAATVYLTLAPQFVPAQLMGVSSMLTLATVHVCGMAVWLGLWSTGLSKISEKFNLADWKRRIDTAGGAVLVFLGIRTALAGNRG
ncbi:LysE family translocator [Brevibacterium sp. UMB10442]|uniref:LysE family translocator n=1 Tax=Brevibacterium sp. UMB1308A TaxID=3050608 RepID=UPI00254B7D30|nr:LysE family translocator [Brevibacterium sp. UMB1308A]MDK7750563.1 LysE family translocator [Brevibacterium sp. UMB10442]MDK8347293.1 LysE family translocator [Brevibacterium sp. UMB1308B]MDK8713421.1 LysE family translocator [Brevibacterium sp. UMB1308A]